MGRCQIARLRNINKLLRSSVGGAAFEQRAFEQERSDIEVFQLPAVGLAPL